MGGVRGNPVTLQHAPILKRALQKHSVAIKCLKPITKVPGLKPIVSSYMHGFEERILKHPLPTLHHDLWMERNLQASANAATNASGMVVYI